MKRVEGLFVRMLSPRLRSSARSTQLVTPMLKVYFILYLLIATFNAVSDDGNEVVSIPVPPAPKKGKNRLNHIVPTGQPAAGHARGTIFYF